MEENWTKTYIYRIIAIITIICLITCSFYGCKDKSKDDSGQATTSSSNKADEDSSGSYSHTSESSSDKTDVSTDGKGTTSSGTSNSGGASSKTTSKKITTKKTTAARTTAATSPPTTKSNTYYAPRVYSNSAPGSAVLASSDGAAVVDYSNASSGYCMIKYAGGFTNIRSQVTGPNGVIQQYMIPANGSYYAIPLTGGSGTYSFNILGNTGGTSYSVVMQNSFYAGLSYSTVAFSRPNINVDYNSSTSCVQYAANLTRGCDTDTSKVEAIYNYVVRNFRYDKAKAASVASTAYIPNLNSVWASKSGICYDYASTMAAMLRTQGIPTKVEVGYVNSAYHAWISCYVKNSGWVDGIISFNGNSWKLMDPTFASTGGNTCDWSQKSNYQVKYLY